MTALTADALVETIADRVVRRTGGDSVVVTAIVRHESERLSHARITAFLPVLIEHAVLHRLRELAVEQQIEDEVGQHQPHPAAEVAMSAWRGDSWMA